MIDAIPVEDLKTKNSRIEIYLDKKHLFNLIEQNGKILIIPVEGTKDQIKYAKMEERK